MPFEDVLGELDERRRQALGMGGAEKLAKRKAQGILNARERLEHLLDDGTFFESGLFATSSRAGFPAGWGRWSRRQSTWPARRWRKSESGSSSIWTGRRRRRTRR